MTIDLKKVMISLQNRATTDKKLILKRSLTHLTSLKFFSFLLAHERLIWPRVTFQHTLVIILFCFLRLDLHVWCEALKRPYCQNTRVVVKVARPASTWNTFSMRNTALTRELSCVPWESVWRVFKHLFTPVKCFFPLSGATHTHENKEIQSELFLIKDSEKWVCLSVWRLKVTPHTDFVLCFIIKLSLKIKTSQKNRVGAKTSAMLTLIWRPYRSTTILLERFISLTANHVKFFWLSVNACRRFSDLWMVSFQPFQLCIGFHSFPYGMKINWQTLESCKIH